MGPHKGPRPGGAAPRRRYSHSGVQGRARPAPRDAVLPGSWMLQAARLHGRPSLRRCSAGPRADKPAGQQAAAGDRGQAEQGGPLRPRDSIRRCCRGSCYIGGCPAPQKVKAVVDRWTALPANGKPRTRPNGKREWTVVAGVVLDGCVVAIASGVKSVPANHGVVIADMHAEILALRAFSRYVVDNNLALDSRNHIELVISHPPCGDASISLTQWDHATCEQVGPGLIRGRSGPHVLGSLRTKPGRADSPRTISKSCSDKLCLRQINGCLSSAAAAISGRVFISDLYTPVVPGDFDRCFDRWNDKHVVQFHWHDASQDLWPDAQGEVVCMTSVVWTADSNVPGRHEVLCNGIKQGAKKNSPSAKSAFVFDGTPAAASSWQKYYPDGWIHTAHPK